MIYLNFTAPSGGSYKATIERLTDGYYREDDSETFGSALAFSDKDITLTEGTLENRGSYTASLDATTWSDAVYRFRAHDILQNSGCVGIDLFGVFNGTEVPVGDETPAYFAQIKYIKDGNNARDELAAIWFRNDQPVQSGSLTHPAISVFNTVDGTAVFQNQSMSYASTTLGSVRYNNGLLPSGEPFLCVVSGVIDSAYRQWRQIVGLDIYY